MKYITLPEMVDYIDATSVVYPITIEMNVLDDSRGDNPFEDFKFTSQDDFHWWLADMAGQVGSSYMRATLARIV
tara:strand:- start:268 stop:489 length:222 start_codon:yes stop_codon:yes gene_type:complete